MIIQQSDNKEDGPSNDNVWLSVSGSTAGQSVAVTVTVDPLTKLVYHTTGQVLVSNCVRSFLLLLLPLLLPLPLPRLLFFFSSFIFFFHICFKSIYLHRYVVYSNHSFKSFFFFVCSSGSFLP